MTILDFFTIFFLGVYTAVFIQLCFKLWKAMNENDMKKLLERTCDNCNTLLGSESYLCTDKCGLCFHFCSTYCMINFYGDDK